MSTRVKTKSNNGNLESCYTRFLKEMIKIGKSIFLTQKLLGQTQKPGPHSARVVKLFTGKYNYAS